MSNKNSRRPKRCFKERRMSWSDNWVSQINQRLPLIWMALCLAIRMTTTSIIFSKLRRMMSSLEILRMALGGIKISKVTLILLLDFRHIHYMRKTLRIPNCLKKLLRRSKTKNLKRRYNLMSGVTWKTSGRNLLIQRCKKVSFPCKGSRRHISRKLIPHCVLT